MSELTNLLLELKTRLDGVEYDPQWMNDMVVKSIYLSQEADTAAISGEDYGVDGPMDGVIPVKNVTLTRTLVQKPQVGFGHTMALMYQKHLLDQNPDVDMEGFMGIVTQAYDMSLEGIKIAKTYAPQPVEPVPDEPVEDPVPGEPVEQVSNILDGPLSVNGDMANVLELANKPEWNVSSGRISLTFTVSDLSGVQGILSKDASGNGDGHFNIWLDGGSLKIRLQTATDEVIFAFDLIGDSQDVRIDFDSGVVKATLNGLVLVDSLDFTLLGNTEFLQIGANGWSSAVGEPGFKQPFKGIIHSVRIDGLNTRTSG